MSQVFKSVLRDYLAVIDYDQTLAHVGDLGQYVAGQNDSVILAQIADKAADLDDLLGVEADCRLVQYYNLGVANQRLSQTHALLVALGQVLNQALAHLAQAGQLADVV